MSTGLDVYIAHVNLGDIIEWLGTSTEEILGTQGQSQIVIQDRTNSLTINEHDDIQLVVHDSGWVLFRGEIITAKGDLPVGMPWTRYTLSCADYNGELSQRLVGAVDGNTWQKIDSLGDYTPIDPYANTLGTDKLTIQQLFDHYFRVDGDAAETDTYVSELLPLGSFNPIYWSTAGTAATAATLASALADLAGLVSSNVQFWLDPDLYFHWQVIPAWQTLAAAGTGSLLRLLAEEVDALADAPVGISDVEDASHIGGRGLTWTFDGSAMPQQVYVRGSTGFTYDDGVDRWVPPPDTPPTPAPKPPGKYQITVNSTTNVYHINPATGYIDEGPPAHISAGNVVYANYIAVPFDPHGTRGGHFYKMVTGPNIGGLLDNDTNVLGYGNITIVIAPTPPPPPSAPPITPPTPVPTIGIGGTGWSGSVLQDPNLRQVYLDAPLSADQPTRDAFGQQVLYRGAYPTLRGTVVVDGWHTDFAGNPVEPVQVDGWRVGQKVPITDARLPADLNGRPYVIQRVQMNLLEGGWRVYTLDWGDGPVQRVSSQGPPKPITNAPAIQLVVSVPNTTPQPGETQTATAQMTDGSGSPWKVPDRAVSWTLNVVDLLGNPVAGQGSLSTLTSVTDRNGQAFTAFTAGTRRDLQYTILAQTPVL